MQFFQSVFHRLLNIGIRSNTPLYDKRVTRLINGIAAGSILVATLSELFILIKVGFVFIGVIQCLFAVVAYTIVLYLNYRNLHYVSRVLIVVYINIALVLMFVSFDYRLRAEDLFLVSFALYVALFKSYRAIIISSISTFILLEIGTYIQVYELVTPLVTFPKNHIAPVRFLFITIAALLILLVTLFFKATSDQYQKELENLNQV